MKFDKAINFFTFMVISLLTAVQNGIAQNVECISNQFIIYQHFLYEAGIIMNTYIEQERQENQYDFTYISILKSYLIYAFNNLNIVGNMKNINNLCTYVSRVCNNHLYESFNGELIIAPFMENKQSPFLINPDVNFTLYPENFRVLPEFSELLPKTTTIRCIPMYYDPNERPDFYITRLSASQYPLFVFKRQPSSTQDDDKKFELAYEVQEVEL